ncbi:MGMT family protein [Bifidobacterium samirii]|uniref:Cysteine methyltransferase n=1 Tax=Bifidobacterium samirii TaxID=2306974 RepID=A0A430FVD4_9BIFI|nr:MGMT family protein [Bifidobacterium samirii]RSX57440.1 cysteine methyltransferase [Bifidobacterium samirii]
MTMDGFARDVLEVVSDIPPGRVASYGQIAALIGRPRNARLVGRVLAGVDMYAGGDAGRSDCSDRDAGDGSAAACRIAYPCHRVVTASGRLVPGWIAQRALLEAEGVGFRADGCVDMARFRWIP